MHVYSQLCTQILRIERIPPQCLSSNLLRLNLSSQLNITSAHWVLQGQVGPSLDLIFPSVKQGGQVLSVKLLMPCSSPLIAPLPRAATLRIGT